MKRLVVLAVLVLATSGCSLHYGNAVQQEHAYIDAAMAGVAMVSAATLGKPCKPSDIACPWKGDGFNAKQSAMALIAVGFAWSSTEGFLTIIERRSFQPQLPQPSPPKEKDTWNE